MSQSILPIKYVVYRTFCLPHKTQDGNILRKMKAANLRICFIYEGENFMGMYSYHSQENILNTKYHQKTNVLIRLCMKYSTNL